MVTVAIDASGPSPDAEALVASGERAPISSWIALALILIVSVYALVDRQIFVLLAEAIRKDMHLGDTQLGLLQGVGLALVGLITTYPIAWVADRVDRRWVSAACVVVWSVAVVGCGLAPNFTWLFIGASLVAVGEAGLFPATFAMIPDLFPLAQRQVANSIFAIASRLTGAVGVYFAGQLVGLVQHARPALPASWAALPDWRLTFVAAALFMPVAVAMLLAMPKRAAGTRKPTVATVETTAGTPEGEGIVSFLRRHAFAQFGFQLGALLMTFGFGAIALWVPVSAQRYFGETPAQSATWLASMGSIASLIGFFGGTPLLAWLQPRLGLRMPIIVAATSVLACGICSAPIAFGQSSAQLYILWGFQVTVGMIAAMVLPTILQNMTPVHLRARMFAIMTLVSLVANGLGPVTVGFISDHLGVAHSLLVAATLVAVISFGLAAAIFWRIRNAYVRLAAEVAI